MKRVLEKSALIFVYSAAILFIITAVTKLISGFGSAPILERHDPLFQVSYRSLFWLAGTLEFGVSLFCILGSNIILRTGLVAWVATFFLLYHMSMPWVGYQRPCPCLGNLTDALHISPQTAETSVKIILAYLLIGSYTSLFWLWRQGNRAEVKAETKAGS